MPCNLPRSFCRASLGNNTNVIPTPTTITAFQELETSIKTSINLERLYNGCVHADSLPLSQLRSRADGNHAHHSPQHAAASLDARFASSLTKKTLRDRGGVSSLNGFSKPGALITRFPPYRKAGPCGEHCRTTSTPSTPPHVKQMPSDKAYIALGSNVGNRLANIEDALKALNDAGLHVTRTSALYETAPMYVEDQATFYNAVCEIDLPPSVTPMELLDMVKDIEDRLGRVKTIEKGPRAIDLDILVFGLEVVDHEHLSIPHHSILEREFVLRPLADLIPNSCLPGLGDRMSVSTYLEALPREIPASITPLKSSIPPLQPGLKGCRTQVMGVLNMTPDSFSDGGKNSLDPTSPQMQEQLSSWLAAGATILDIGGQSTAPKAPSVTAAEELDRILPLIKHIRSDLRFDDVALSVDTFRASVARAAIEAGADIVNDVSAGTLDPDMLPTVAALRVPIILMHMRGDPSSMQTMCDYSPDGLLPNLAKELGKRVEAAMRAGIPRWKIVLDPGIGFAKQRAQNVEILRDLQRLMEARGVRGLPWLVGTSRKAFIGHILGVKKADERDWGTAAAVTAAVAAGADIVRVHNQKLAQTVTMADAIWKDTHRWK